MTDKDLEEGVEAYRIYRDKLHRGISVYGHPREPWFIWQEKHCGGNTYYLDENRIRVINAVNKLDLLERQALKALEKL